MPDDALPPTPANFDKLIEEGAARASRVYEEAIRDVFARMPWGQNFTLANAAKVKISKGGDPKRVERSDHLNDRWYFVFDVEAEDGGFHVEFICYQSGWGAAPAGLALEAGQSGKLT